MPYRAIIEMVFDDKNQADYWLEEAEEAGGKRDGELDGASVSREDVEEG